MWSMSDAPVWVQIVVILIGLVCIAAAVWATVKNKDRLADRDYRDDI